MTSKKHRSHSLNRIQSLYWGASLPMKAAKTIFSHRILLLWSIIPVAITVTIYYFFIANMQHYVQGIFQTYLLKWGIDLQGWLAYSFLLITRLILFIISIITFSILSTIIACPLNDILAQKTEAFATPPLSKVPNQPLHKKIKWLLVDLLKSTVAMAINIFALFFSWFPFFNIFALFLVFLIVAFQYISYPQTRREQGIRAGISFLWQHTYSCLGFGAVFSFLFNIPIISSFCLPLAVVGGTLLAARAKGSATLPRLQ